MKYWFVCALIVEIVFTFQCVDLRKFCQRGSNSTLIFFLIRVQIALKAGAIIGPPVKRHLNGVSLAG